MTSNPLRDVRARALARRLRAEGRCVVTVFEQPTKRAGLLRSDAWLCGEPVAGEGLCERHLWDRRRLSERKARA